MLTKEEIESNLRDGKYIIGNLGGVHYKQLEKSNLLFGFIINKVGNVDIRPLSEESVKALQERFNGSYDKYIKFNEWWKDFATINVVYSIAINCRLQSPKKLKLKDLLDDL